LTDFVSYLKRLLVVHNFNRELRFGYISFNLR